MPKRILLLTGKVEAPHLMGMLHRAHPELRVDWVPNRRALDAAVARGVEDTRMVSILSDVLVPGRMLAALPGPAYNFHPGPPEYPGSRAASFAIYEGAEWHGITLHEMAAKVDSGPIVEVRRFSLSGNEKFADVEMRAFAMLIEMFKDYVEHLALNDDPLPHSGDRWTGRTRTNAEAEAMKVIESDMSEAEIGLRYRAFG